MTNSKALFIRPDPDGNQSLSQWWASVVNDDRFAMVLTFARASLMENRPSAETIQGAEIMALTLQTLSENETSSTTFPSPGLHHRMPEKGGEQPQS